MQATWATNMAAQKKAKRPQQIVIPSLDHRSFFRSQEMLCSLFIELSPIVTLSLYDMLRNGIS